MWRFLERWFGRAAPTLTIDQKIAQSFDDRELIRLAGEAIRANQSQLAYQAYWKAAQLYMQQQHHLKVLAMITPILRLAPGDVNAHLARIHALELVGRHRDAAYACLETSQILQSAGDLENAQVLWTRAHELDPSLSGGQVAESPAVPSDSVPIVVGTPSIPAANTGVIELDLEIDVDEAPHPVIVAAAAPEFSEAATYYNMEAVAPPDALVEANTCYNLEAIPAAMLGTEHEAVARGYLDPSTSEENATRAYDQSELSTLLDEASAA